MDGIPSWMWLVFAAVVLVSIMVDLISHRGDRTTSKRAAWIWSGVWIAVSIAFGMWIAAQLGPAHAVDYFSAYVMEKSLSVDNLFVFLIVFRQLQIPSADQHRVLFWGVFGALVARALFIGAGVEVLARWHSAVYVLGAFLVYTGWTTARAKPSHDTGENRALVFVRKHFRISSSPHGHHFFARENGRRVATPLFLALVAIELSDIMFAVDSVPAVLAISDERFIIYSSNVFAILGLRALYVVLADMLDRLVYLHYGLGVILALAGGKMLASGVVHIPHLASLAAIIVVLTITILASTRATRGAEHPAAPDYRPSRS